MAQLIVPGRAEHLCTPLGRPPGTAAPHPKPTPTPTTPHPTPAVLRFLIASRDEVDSVQLRDDLLSMLVSASHEGQAEGGRGRGRGSGRG